jgi:hypothetical protein
LKTNDDVNVLGEIIDFFFCELDSTSCIKLLPSRYLSMLLAIIAFAGLAVCTGITHF